MEHNATIGISFAAIYPPKKCTGCGADTCCVYFIRRQPICMACLMHNFQWVEPFGWIERIETATLASTSKGFAGEA